MRKNLISICIVGIWLCGIYKYVQNEEEILPTAVSVVDVESVTESIMNNKPAGEESPEDESININVNTVNDNNTSEVQEIGRSIQNMPEIEIISDYGVETKIRNEEEYEGFISRLEELTGYKYLWIDLEENSTTIYLDEVLTYNNFEFLQIKNGGSISFKDTQILNYPIHTIELSHVFSIEKDLLSHIISGKLFVQYNLVIELDNRYSGKLPIEELLDYKDCMNVILVWDGNTEGGALFDVRGNMENLKEWDYLQSVQEATGGCLKGIYSLNDGDYCYTSYEFYNHYEESVPEVCAAFICVKDKESNGEEYFDIIDVPTDKFLNYLFLRDTYPRVGVGDDLNFDGFNDLVFMGRNDGIYPYWSFITFLWNEEKQRFILDESTPITIDRVDTERKRLTHSNVSSLEDDYYIYEYRDRVFTEKHLEIKIEDMYGKRVTEKYFEDGELIAQLERATDEDGSIHYFYEKIGGNREEIQVESGLSFHRVSGIYFPEFDFWKYG